MSKIQENDQVTGKHLLQVLPSSDAIGVTFAYLKGTGVLCWVLSTLPHVRKDPQVALQHVVGTVASPAQGLLSLPALFIYFSLDFFHLLSAGTLRTGTQDFPKGHQESIQALKLGSSRFQNSTE